MSGAVMMPPHTPTGADLGIEISEKKGGGGGHGSGGHGHGGRPGVGPGPPGSAHRSTAARSAIPRLFHIFV
jgi:hypothetical protein